MNLVHMRVVQTNAKLHIPRRNAHYILLIDFVNRPEIIQHFIPTSNHYFHKFRIFYSRFKIITNTISEMNLRNIQKKQNELHLPTVIGYKEV